MYKAEVQQERIVTIKDGEGMEVRHKQGANYLLTCKGDFLTIPEGSVEEVIGVLQAILAKEKELDETTKWD